MAFKKIARFRSQSCPVDGTWNKYFGDMDCRTTREESLRRRPTIATTGPDKSRPRSNKGLGNDLDSQFSNCDSFRKDLTTSQSAGNYNLRSNYNRYGKENIENSIITKDQSEFKTHDNKDFIVDCKNCEEAKSLLQETGDCCSCECQHDRSFQVLQDESRNKRRSATSGQRQQGVQDIKYKSLSRWDNFSFIRKPTVERFQGHQLHNILNLAHSWIRRNMGLFVFECFIILVVFISISGTVMLINNHNDKPDKFDKVLPIEPLTSSENKDDEYSDFWVSDDYKDIVTSHELKDNNPANEYKHVVSLHGHKNMMPATDQADKREKDKTNYMDTVLPLEKIGKFGEDNSNVVLDIPYQSVSLADFEAHLVRAKSAEELMKIFFKDPNLSAEQIRSIMYMKQNPKLYSTDFDPELPAHAPEAEDMEAAFAHHMEVMTSPNSECVPRPETERIEEVHEDSVKHFLPSCTIVHRCRKTTSCCPRGHECVPTKEGIELFDKKFMVLEMQRGSEHLLPAKEHMVVAKTFVNHTACECRRMLVSSNCDKDCPQQFRKERPGIDCVCTCRQGHGKCRRIQRGLVALDEEDLVCIKEGNCIIPECQTGEFDVAKGFCSRSQRHKRNRG